MLKSYAGIGSRSTPEPIVELFERAARRLALEQWVLRSGRAEGADHAFENGAHTVADATAEIFVPWPSFNADSALFEAALSEPVPAAFKIAAQHHPAWDRCSQAARKLHARNVHQILGTRLQTEDAVKFVICWTPEGSGSGGTGQAIRLAAAFNVPVFDAGLAIVENRLRRKFDSAPQEDRAPCGVEPFAQENINY